VVLTVAGVPLVIDLARRSVHGEFGADHLAGMALAASGALSPVAGAVAQEAIDLIAVLNALRVAGAPATLTDVRVTGA
jgi:hypothetical protein